MEQTVSAYMLYLQCGHIMCRKQLNPFPHVGVLVKQRFFVLLSCGQWQSQAEFMFIKFSFILFASLSKFWI